MEPILMKGNEVLAQAAIFAGCRQYFGYPITPQTEIAAYMSRQMPKAGGVYLQAESEVAAINMVLGAGAAGGRAMTSTSSPGLSLMTEGISYIAGMDIPCLIVNVQRGGPGLGGIQPSQADYWQATRALGHGDFHVMVFAPSSVQEIADLVPRAFDLADQYRVPAMFLMDGSLGQMMEPVAFPDKPADPGALPEKPWAAVGNGGKRPNNILNSLMLKAPVLEASVLERFDRYEAIKQELCEYEAYRTGDAQIVLVAYGTTARIAKSVVDEARKEGIKAGMFRPVTLWPYPYEPLSRLSARCFLAVEMSMGQMVEDVRLAVNGRAPVHFYGRTGGMIPRPNEVLKRVRALAKDPSGKGADR